MKINQLKAGSILSYAQMLIGIVIGLLYTPVMIELLGKSEYGLYNTVSSAISMMSVLSLGFNSSYIRFYSKYKKEDNRESIYRLNGVYLMIYMVIAVITFVCGIFLTNNLHIVFDEGLTPGEYEIAKKLMILLIINLSASFPMSLFSSIIAAHENFVILKLMSIGKTVFGPLVTLPLLLMGFRSVAMVLVTVGISLAIDICYLIFVLVVLKQKFIIGRVETGLFWNILSYTSFIAINLIIDQINANAGKFLLGRYRGTDAVAIYSVGYQLYQYYTIFSSAISNVLTPRIHRIILETKENMSLQRERLTALFTKVGRIQFLILALISTGVLFFGKPFIMNIWAGEDYKESYAVTLWLIFSSTVAMIQTLGIEIQRAQNRHRFRSGAYALMAILNFVLTVFLSKPYGATGAAIGTSVSLFIANVPVMNLYYHKRCNIDMITFWKSIISQAKGIIIPLVAGVLINIFFDLNKIIFIGAGIILYSAVYCGSMWLFGMNEYEKELAMKPVRKLLGKRK